MVPANFTRILELPEDMRGEYDLSSLKIVVHAAAPCPVPLKRAFMDFVGADKVWEYFGASEGGGTVISPQEWLEHPGNGSAGNRGQEARAFVRRLAAALFTKQGAPRRIDIAPAPPPSSPDLPAADVPEVIVVEDDPTLAELLTFGLEARGYRFVHYRNGREALDALRELETHGQTPLLLLDVDLPALDGYSIFDALKDECPGKFRVVFTTVHGSESEQLRGLEAGALDYMVKPMSLRVALEKIRRWVGR